MRGLDADTLDYIDGMEGYLTASGDLILCKDGKEILRFDGEAYRSVAEDTEC